MEFEEGDTECLGQFQLREKVNRHKKFEGKTKKVLKTIFEKQNTCFSRLIQVARTLAKTLQAKRFEKICKVFFATGSLTCEGVAS